MEVTDMVKTAHFNERLKQVVGEGWQLSPGCYTVILDKNEGVVSFALFEREIPEPPAEPRVDDRFLQEPFEKKNKPINPDMEMDGFDGSCP
jgi:hypothetical protein